MKKFVINIYFYLLINITVIYIFFNITLFFIYYLLNIHEKEYGIVLQEDAARPARSVATALTTPTPRLGIRQGFEQCRAHFLHRTRSPHG